MKTIFTNLFKKYKEALGIFLVSRILIFFIFSFLFTYNFGIPQFSQWDANTYLSIAKEGYQFFGSYKDAGSYIAFFPLFPLIVRIFSEISHADILFSALSLNLVFGICSAVLIYKIARDRWGKDAAINSVLLFSFFPTSIFLTVPYSESLFLFVVLLSFILLENKKFFYASVFISLSLITRLTGIILIPALFYYLFRKKIKIFLWPIYIAISLLPFLIFLYFQYINYGTPLAFLEAQRINWYHQLVFPWIGFGNLIGYALSSGSLSTMWRTDLVMLSIMIITLILAKKNINAFFMIFGFGVILLTINQSFILGTSRYMLMVLPFYFFWGKFLTKHSLAKQIVLAISISWMTFNSILFLLSKPLF